MKNPDDFISMDGLILGLQPCIKCGSTSIMVEGGNSCPTWRAYCDNCGCSTSEYSRPDKDAVIWGKMNPLLT